MKNYLLFGCLALLITFTSCKDDEDPTPSHEIGTWELDSYVFINFPTGYTVHEGSVYTLSQLTFGGTTFEDYTLVLEKNGSYSRTIGIAGPDVDDEGTWTLSDDELTLESEDGDEDWTVEKNEDDDLWLSVEQQSSFIPDIYYDTVTQDYIDYLNTLTDAQLDSVSDALSSVVTFDLVFVFERED